MNREQCRAILANLPLIQHYAAGGDIGFYIHDSLFLTNKITLGCLHEAGTSYVRLKTRIAFNPETGASYPVARPRAIGAVHIPKHEIIGRTKP